jgi:hypothetical protein
VNFIKKRFIAYRYREATAHYGQRHIENQWAAIARRGVNVDALAKEVETLVFARVREVYPEINREQAIALQAGRNLTRVRYLKS